MLKKFSFLFSRFTLTMLLVFMQIGLFLWMIYVVSNYWRWNLIFFGVSVIIVIFLLAKEENPTYKMAWVVPIMLFPVFGGVFYLFYRRRNLSRRKVLRHLAIEAERQGYLKDHPPRAKTREAAYLYKRNWAAYENTESTFLESGEAMLTWLLKDLEAAKHFIFLEFFVIKKSTMWTQILDVLKQKAQEGVEVCVMYDDFGSSALPYKYPKYLASFGIKAEKFNPIKPRLNFGNNYRNHRKIIVVDNKIGYSVGNNIADEYINFTQPFGTWADTGIRLNGEATWSLTVAFLDAWSFTRDESIDYEDYNYKHTAKTDGEFMPFTDTPLDNEETTKQVYLSMIYSAKKSIFVTTPYLIIDPEFKNALTFAAKSGVDVNIVIPGIPDKQIIYMVTESHLPTLMREGVKIYRYTPGFMHAKMMLIDDEKAMIGSANLDYRSLYLHFENSVYVYKSSFIESMRTYFDEVIHKSEKVPAGEKKRLLYRGIQLVFRTFKGIM